MKPAGPASSKSYYKGAAARLSVVRGIDVCGTRLAFQLARLEATLVCPLSLLSIVPPRSLKEGLTRASVVFGKVPHAGAAISSACNSPPAKLSPSESRVTRNSVAGMNQTALLAAAVWWACDATLLRPVARRVFGDGEPCARPL